MTCSVSLKHPISNWQQQREINSRSAFNYQTVICKNLAKLNFFQLPLFSLYWNLFQHLGNDQFFFLNFFSLCSLTFLYISIGYIVLYWNMFRHNPFILFRTFPPPSLHSHIPISGNGLPIQDWITVLTRTEVFGSVQTYIYMYIHYIYGK